MRSTLQASSTVLKPIIIFYPKAINVGPNNQLGIHIPDSGTLLIVAAEGFRSLVTEFGDDLSFKRFKSKETDNFFGLLRFSACSSVASRKAAERTRIVFCRRLSAALGVQLEAFITKVKTNEEVFRQASMLH